MWGFFKRKPECSAAGSIEERELAERLVQSRERAKRARSNLRETQIDLRTAVVDQMLAGVIQDRER